MRHHRNVYSGRFVVTWKILPSTIVHCNRILASLNLINLETVTSDVLAVWLGSKKSVLLIDCRGFLSQDKKKLRGALAMKATSIKIKRCKGKLTSASGRGLLRNFRFSPKLYILLKRPQGTNFNRVFVLRCSKIRVRIYLRFEIFLPISQLHRDAWLASWIFAPNLHSMIKLEILLRDR